MKGKFAISLLITGIVFWGVEFCAFACGFEEYREINYSKEMVQAMNSIFKVRNEIGLEKGDEKLLVLTNAGYGTINDTTTEAFLDIISNVTACTMGTRNGGLSCRKCITNAISARKSRIVDYSHRLRPTFFKSI